MYTYRQLKNPYVLLHLIKPQNAKIGTTTHNFPDEITNKTEREKRNNLAKSL